MLREWRWLIGVSAALVVGALVAESYARAAIPYYTLVARWIAAEHPWTIVSMDVSEHLGRGAILQMVSTVRAHIDDPAPAARLVAKLQVAAVVESPLIFWSVLLMWPCTEYRQRLLGLLTGIPVFLALEVATTVCQLLTPLAYASAVLAGKSVSVTLWEHWSRFLEEGGRVTVALVAALCTIALVGGIDRAAARSTGEGQQARKLPSSSTLHTVRSPPPLPQAPRPQRRRGRSRDHPDSRSSQTGCQRGQSFGNCRPLPGYCSALCADWEL